MVRRKCLNVPSYILCQSCLCVTDCNWMSPIISKAMPGDTGSVKISHFTEHVSCTYGTVLTTENVSWVLFTLRSAFGILRAHEGCSKCPQRGFCWWRMDFCTKITNTCNVRGYWVAIQLRPTAKSHTRWYFKNHITSSCYSAVGLVPSSKKSL